MLEPRHERKSLAYLRWDDKYHKEKPYQIVSENIPELDHLARSNITMVGGPEELIEDIRGREGSFILDQNGFQITKYQFAKIDYQSKDDVERVYKPEVERLLRTKVPGVDKVVFFNWRVRQAPSDLRISLIVKIGTKIHSTWTEQDHLRASRGKIKLYDHDPNQSLSL